MTRFRSFRRSVTATAILAAAVSLSACGALKYGDFPAARPREAVHNPLPALDDISVARVSLPEEYADRDWTQYVEGALLAVDGIKRVHRVDWPASAGKRDEFPTPEPSSKGLLALKVLSFDPYYPPRAHVEVDFFVSQVASDADRSMVELERLGSAPGSGKKTSQTPWIRFQRVFSVADPEVAARLRVFARSQGDEKRGTTPSDRLVVISDRFMDFVMHETVRDCFSRIESKEVESNGLLGQLLARSAGE